MTLRETIKNELKEKWSQDLEDRLFWVISEFVSKAVQQTKRETQNNIKDALGIT